ncbi:UNVERIFIED_CONTAM: Voltage-dependent calcium channel subunit alpha-2/delta-3 [Gekko kuhli]
MPGTGSLLRTFAALLALSWTALSLRSVAVAGAQQQIPLSVVKLWASAFGGEIRSIAAKYSGSQLLQKASPGMYYIITDKGNECGYLLAQLHSWVISL